MKINTDLKNFRKNHLKKINQVISSVESFKDEKIIENFFLSCANKFNVPIVATNNNYFTNSEMHEATDALLCIKNVEKLQRSCCRPKDLFQKIHNFGRFTLTSNKDK